MSYKKEIKTVDERIFSEMRICSFDLVCSDYKIDFVDKKSYELYRLYKEKDALASYFSIPGSQENALKIYLPRQSYAYQIKKIKEEKYLEFLVIVLVVALLSLLFSFYTLSPLRNALHLTEEFIKDILHDFNTPLATLRLNSAMLQKELGSNSKVTRIERSVQTILNLQSNLRAYLSNHQAQKESFYLKVLLQERVELLEASYKNIQFFIEVDKNIYVQTNKEAFIRVIDNILSNAVKYNKKDGKVILRYKNAILEIEDTGKGIKNPKKVFQRFYKEQERGIGIGLHIVQKLCEELNISLALSSQLGVGTLLKLSLKNIIQLKDSDSL